jgi:hypothetical protein
MANFFPLIINPVGNVIQELPSADFLDLSQSGIANSGNITVSGVISATGNITGANINGAHFGSGAGLSSITGANVTGTVPSATSATTAGTVTTAAQPNITSVGTLSSLAVTGNITAGNVSATLFTGTATQARYADLAEMYAADANYAPGTVLIFGGNNEVTVSTGDAQTQVAGVVSTNAAHIMNTGISAEYPVTLALAGRVPTKVYGPVKKGDMMVSAADGYARACATPAMCTVIGKALEEFNGTTGVIEVVINNM